MTAPPALLPVRGTKTLAKARQISGWRLVALLAALGTLWMSVGPLAETDVFWHIKVGEVLTSHLRFPWPDPWSYTLPDAHWQSTSWLSEVLFYGVYQAGGAVGISALRLVLVAGLCLLLARQLIPRHTPWVGTAVFSVVSLSMSVFDQERPQLISLLFLVWLASVCRTTIRERRPPHPALVGVVAWAWANFHGYWTLVPLALAGTAACLLADREAAAQQLAKKCATGALAAVVGAALTPAGPGLLLSPFTVASAARGVISEWLPLDPATGYAVIFLLAVVAFVVAWGRSADRIPRGELLWVLAWVAYALAARRNAGPGLLLLAPWLADRLELTYGDGRQGPLVPRALLPAVAGVMLPAIALMQYAQPAVDPTKPAAIAHRLAAQQQNLRVLDDYNVSGFLILYGGDHIRLAIDGRADRYGHDFIKRYSDAFLGIDWKPLVRQLTPDVAVVLRDSPLNEQLQDAAHWKPVQRDGSWVLLARPRLALT